jgi:hypothetical protein
MRAENAFLPALALLVAVLGPSVEAGPAHRGLLKLGGAYVKWGPAAYATPAEITYAELTEPRSFPGARNCPEMRPMDALLQRSGIARAELEREVDAAFGLWASIANLRFVRVRDVEAAQIIIGEQVGTRGVAWTNVVQQRRPRGGVDGISQATICLDPSERWEVGIDGDPETYNLRYVMTHEIGHAIGLDHPGAEGGIMGFAYHDPVDRERGAALAASDIAAVVALYGAAGAPSVGARLAAPAVVPVAPTSCLAAAAAGHGPVTACGLTPGIK